jgi:hypothetical protein
VWVLIKEKKDVVFMTSRATPESKASSLGLADQEQSLAAQFLGNFANASVDEVDLKQLNLLGSLPTKGSSNIFGAIQQDQVKYLRHAAVALFGELTDAKNSKYVDNSNQLGYEYFGKVTHPQAVMIQARLRQVYGKDLPGIQRFALAMKDYSDRTEHKKIMEGIVNTKFGGAIIDIQTGDFFGL